uniref:MAX network transcriptional repressor a n=1 Tax=Salarias fasciatus TaxID=181472 RepID=A0A672IHR9_SALFA
MSIETLLEAAKFLEWQAQQQQKARGEFMVFISDADRVARAVKGRCLIFDIASLHVSKAFRAEELHAESCPAPVPPSLKPPSMPVAVVPVPVVTPNPTGSPTLPVATLSPPAAPPVSSPKSEPHSPQEQSAAALLFLPQQHHTQLIAPAGGVPVPAADAAAARRSALPPAPSFRPRCSPPGCPRRRAAPSAGGVRPTTAGSSTARRGLEGESERPHRVTADQPIKINQCVYRFKLPTLKRKEKEYEHDMERLAREKIATQQRLDELKNELSQWMDVDGEIDRVVRQATQPEEDQASTSTASEGEDNMDEDVEEEPASRAPAAMPGVPQSAKPELLQTAPPAQAPTLTPITTLVTAPSLHPTVIAHASVSHPSVIQAVNHVIQGGAPKHIAHLAPSPAAAAAGPVHQPIGHITVHPVAHLGQHLPALYPQPVAVTQHITHTLNHAHPQVNGAAVPQAAAAIVTKSAQMMAHHPQLVGQTVLNPVAMVTMPSFPISTLKLA